MIYQKTNTAIALSGLLGIGILSPLTPVIANSMKKASSSQTTSPPSSVIYVNPVAGKDQPGAGTTAATALHTITSALRQASPGTTIQLAPGNYSMESGEVFPLTVKPGITLKGDETGNGQRVVIKGGNYYLSRLFRQQNVTIVAEKDSLIRGVTVTNPEQNGTALWIESANPTVSHNTFSSNGKTGIFVAGTANPLVESNIFTQNDIGILLTSSVLGEVRQNLFQQNNQFGLSIVGTSSPLVIGNKIIENKDGVQLSNEVSPILQNNVISNNRGSGIVLVTFSEAQPNEETIASLRGNMFTNNGQHDINWSSD